MKKLISIFVFTIFFTCLIIPQQKEVNKYEQKAKTAFNLIPESLDHKIPGIVESTIYTLILVKKYYPSADYTEIIDKLNEIAVKDLDPSMRVRAFLAAFYLGSDNVIDVIPVHNTLEHEYIYKQITEQLSNKLLADK